MRVNISGCTNSCGQHHISDIGFFGLERRAHGSAAPGYQMLLGGHVGEMEVEFGEKAAKLPAKAASEAVVRVVGRFADERDAGETFPPGSTASGGAERGRHRRSSDLDEFPDARRRTPSSTSTSTRPAPTSPRSATASART